jgi:hypothetical protein
MFMHVNKVLCEGKMTVNNQSKARRSDLEIEEQYLKDEMEKKRFRLSVEIKVKQRKHMQ